MSNPLAGRRSSARRTRRGYTIIEVMMAIAVLALGATGIVAMQKVTLAGNQNARAINTANLLAQTWVERLRGDATLWNLPNNQSDLGETRWLQYAVPRSGQWFTPDGSLNGVTPNGSAMADQLGGDLYLADLASYTQGFCTQIRLFPLATVDNTPNGTPSFIRAEIRVFWAKGNAKGRGGTGRPIACGDVQTGAETNYGFVYVTTGLTPNIIQN